MAAATVSGALANWRVLHHVSNATLTPSLRALCRCQPLAQREREREGEGGREGGRELHSSARCSTPLALESCDDIRRLHALVDAVAS